MHSLATCNYLQLPAKGTGHRVLQGWASRSRDSYERKFANVRCDTVGAEGFVVCSEMPAHGKLIEADPGRNNRCGKRWQRTVGKELSAMNCRQRTIGALLTGPTIARNRQGPASAATY